MFPATASSRSFTSTLSNLGQPCSSLFRYPLSCENSKKQAEHSVSVAAHLTQSLFSSGEREKREEHVRSVVARIEDPDCLYPFEERGSNDRLGEDEEDGKEGRVHRLPIPVSHLIKMVEMAKQRVEENETGEDGHLRPYLSQYMKFAMLEDGGEVVECSLHCDQPAKAVVYCGFGCPLQPLPKLWRQDLQVEDLGRHGGVVVILDGLRSTLTSEGLVMEAFEKRGRRWVAAMFEI